jgi:hypothetical protein
MDKKSTNTQAVQKSFNKEKFRCILKVLYSMLFDKEVEKMNGFVENKEDFQVNEKEAIVEAGIQFRNSDPYLFKMRSFLLGEGEFKDLNPLMELTDTSFVKIFNQLFIDFNDFEDKYKEQVLTCGLDEILVNTKARCQKKFGEQCQLRNNKVSYGVKCMDGYIPYKEYFCYIKCPESYVDQFNKCIKPAHKTVTSLFNLIKR